MKKILSTILLQPAANAAVPWYLSGGVASCLGAWNGKVADEATSLVNLANPGTYDLTKINTPVFSAGNGWQGVGATSSAYNTGITPTADTWTYIVRVSGAGSAIVMGYSNGTAHLWLRPNNGSSQRQYHHYSTTAVTVATAVTTGILAVAGPNCYKDGAADGTITQDGSGLRLPVYICARNTNPGASSILTSGYVNAAAIYNTTLSPAQVAAITTAMAAL